MSILYSDDTLKYQRFLPRSILPPDLYAALPRSRISPRFLPSFTPPAMFQRATTLLKRKLGHPDAVGGVGADTESPPKRARLRSSKGLPLGLLRNAQVKKSKATRRKAASPATPLRPAYRDHYSASPASPSSSSESSPPPVLPPLVAHYEGFASDPFGAASPGHTVSPTSVAAVLSSLLLNSPPSHLPPTESCAMHSHNSGSTPSLMSDAESPSLEGDHQTWRDKFEALSVTVQEAQVVIAQQAGEIRELSQEQVDGNRIQSALRSKLNSTRLQLHQSRSSLDSTRDELQETQRVLERNLEQSAVRFGEVKDESEARLARIKALQSRLSRATAPSCNCDDEKAIMKKAVEFLCHMLGDADAAIIRILSAASALNRGLVLIPFEGSLVPQLFNDADSVRYEANRLRSSVGTVMKMLDAEYQQPAAPPTPEPMQSELTEDELGNTPPEGWTHATSEWLSGMMENTSSARQARQNAYVACGGCWREKRRIMKRPLQTMPQHLTSQHKLPNGTDPRQYLVQVPREVTDQQQS